MFLFLNRRIGIFLKKAPVTSEISQEEINKLLLLINSLKDEVKTVEVFSRDVNLETTRKIEDTKVLQDELALSYDQWNNIYIEFNDMVANLNEKQNHYNELLTVMSTAEQHSNDLQNKINTFNELQNGMLDLQENIEKSLHTMKEEKQEVLENIKYAKNTFDSEIEKYKEKGSNDIKQEIELIKDAEFKRISIDFDNIHKNNNQQIDNMSQKIKTELQMMSNKIGELNGSFENRIDYNIVHMQEEAGRIHQEFDKTFNSYKEKINDIVLNSNENYNKIKIQYQESYDEIRNMKNKELDDLEVKIREKKNGLYLYAETQAEKLQRMGETSFYQLTSSIDEKKLSLEEQIAELINNTDLQITKISNDTKERIHSLERSHQEQFDNFVQQMNELTQAGKSVEEETNQKIQELHTHIAGVAHNLEYDYENLAKEKDMLISSMDEIKNNYEHIETQVREQLTAEFEGHTSNMRRHLKDIMNEVNINSDAHMEEIQTLFNEAKVEHKQDLQKIKQDYIETLTEKSSEFKEAFDDYKTVLWGEVEKYKNSIEEIKNELNDGLLEQKQLLQDEIDEKKQLIHSEIDGVKKHILEDINEEKQLIHSEMDGVKKHILEDITEFKNTVDNILEDQNSSIEEKIDILNKELHNYNQKIRKELQQVSEATEIEYLEKLKRHNENFDEDLKNISTRITKLHDYSEDSLKVIDEKFFNIKKDAEDKKKDYEKFLKTIETQNATLFKDLEKANERYNNFLEKHNAFEEKINQLKNEKELIDKQMIEVESFKAVLSTMRKEYNDVKKDLESTSKNLLNEKKHLKDALTNYKISTKTLNHLEDKMQKTRRDMQLLEQQSNNINDIKTKLSEITDFQQQVKEQQKELNKWEHDYELIQTTFASLLKRNHDIDEKTSQVENRFDTWQHKIETTSKSISSIEGRFSKIEILHDEIENFEKKMPDIKNNLEEFKEVRSSLIAQEANVQDTLLKADTKLQALRMIHARNSTGELGEEMGASKPEMKKTVIHLHNIGWKEDIIAAALSLTIDEVKLILQKSTLA